MNKIMEKKQYIAPTMGIAEIEMVSMMAASIGVGEGEAGADGAWSNDRRGSWGNLWSDDKK